MNEIKNQNRIVIPEKYGKNISIENAVTMECGDAVMNILHNFGIVFENAAVNDDRIVNCCVELTTAIEKYIRDYYNIPEEQMYAEGDMKK